MATLAEIRAKLQQSAQTQTATTGDNGVFPHWNIPEGSTTSLRFLPDGDANNTFFWIERALIKLPFAGVKGEVNSKPVQVQVPCMEMWNETCPVLSQVRPWFKDKSLEDMGRKYWKKKSYLFQGFVVDTVYKEEGKTPDNPIRRFIMGSQIFNIVKNALMDPEIEELPTDYLRGLDFKVTKTKKGDYADYSTSTWARRERALNEKELAAIDQYGLFDLKSFLPKKPGQVELKAIEEMFEASVDGEAFDMDRWGQYYKPSGYTGGSADGDDSASVKSTPTAPVVVSKPVIAEKQPDPVQSSDAETSTASSRAHDILQMIKNRNKS